MPAIQGIYHAADSGEEMLRNLIILASEWVRKVPKWSGKVVVERMFSERVDGRRKRVVMRILRQCWSPDTTGHSGKVEFACCHHRSRSQRHIFQPLPPWLPGEPCSRSSSCLYSSLLIHNSILACRYNKYAQITARALRASLKEEERVIAEKRGLTSSRYQKWENGLGGLYVRVLRASLWTAGLVLFNRHRFRRKYRRNKPWKEHLNYSRM
jgi:F-type H+-transporting ATPase subunit epsilon